MRTILKRAKGVLDSWSRQYICDEDPDERRERLRAEALKEIDANVLVLVQLREAMRLALEPECEKKRKEAA